MREGRTDDGWTGWQDIGPGDPGASGGPGQDGQVGAEGLAGDGSKPAFGPGYYPPAVEALFAGPRRRSGPSTLSIVAALCGALGFALGPFLVGDHAGRYVILLADLAAIALGVYALVAAARSFGRYDEAVFGIALAGVSLALWISYVTSHVASGGT